MDFRLYKLNWNEIGKCGEVLTIGVAMIPFYADISEEGVDFSIASFVERLEDCLTEEVLPHLALCASYSTSRFIGDNT